MKDKYLTKLVWVSIVLIVIGVIIWIFGDAYYGAGYTTLLGWYIFVYGGIILILMGTLVWAYISHKIKLI
jgi:cation transporter-like permease